MNSLSLSLPASIRDFNDRPRQIGVLGALLLHLLVLFLLWPRDPTAGLPEADSIEVEIIALGAPNAAPSEEAQLPAPTQLPPVQSEAVQNAIQKAIKTEDSELEPPTPPEPQKKVKTENFKSVEAVQFAPAVTPQASQTTQAPTQTQMAEAPKLVPAIQFQESAKPEPILKVDTPPSTERREFVPAPPPNVKFEDSLKTQASATTQSTVQPQAEAAKPVAAPAFEEAANDMRTSQPDEQQKVASKVINGQGTANAGLGVSAQGKELVPLSEHMQGQGGKTPPLFDSSALNNPKPKYPLSARAKGIQGTVMVFVQVGFDGEPTAVEIWQTSQDPVLDEEALRTVRKWHFIPATSNGRPISASVIVPVDFRLE